MEVLVFDLLITAVGYLIVPLIIILTGKKYGESKLKKIAIINGVVVWLIFSIISINAGGEASKGIATILWALLGYYLMKKCCTEEKAELQNVDSDNNEDMAVCAVQQSETDEVQDENEETGIRSDCSSVPEKKRLSKKVSLIILIVSIVIGALFCIKYLGFGNPSIEEIKDSVVKIEVFDEDGSLMGTGSGFCAFESNYIITNFHVIEGARTICIITDSQKEYEVKNIVLYNKKEDLAILDIDGSLKILNLGDTKKLKVKDKVTAIGSPMGELNTVSEGIVSNVDDKKIIRTTTPISHGSSGGVLLDKANNVIGITSAGYDEAQNLNFAINISVLKKMHAALENEEYAVLNSSLYTNFCPNIINYNTNNKLEIKEKLSFSSLYNYEVDSLETFYKATNEYHIFNTAMYKLGINGFNEQYKLMNESEQRMAASNYTYLLQFESGLESVGESVVASNVSAWSKEEFIINLDLMCTYELAILMVKLDENMSSKQAWVAYLNNSPLSYESKIILNRLLYPDDNRYNKEIIEYFNGNDDYDYDQTVAVLKYLGMRVDSNGTVRW